jgi:hypothetical protein
MEKPKNDVQAELDKYRETGVAYLSAEDKDLDFANLSPEKQD